MSRTLIGDGALNLATIAFRQHMEEVLKRKGRGAFVSRHEILGVIEDECIELVNAVQAKRGLKDIRHELLDIAVAALFGVACIEAKVLDW